jgi:hypothetical protein
MPRLTTSLAAALLLLVLGAAPAAQARVVATSTTGYVAGPALASDGRVVVGQRYGSSGNIRRSPSTRAAHGRRRRSRRSAPRRRARSRR